MTKKRTVLIAGVVTLALTCFMNPARAETPDWARPALKYLDDSGYLDKDEFRPNWAMTRAAFKSLVRKAFGRGHYKRTEGKVTAGEVGEALVDAVGKLEVSEALDGASSPDGWKPARSSYFGTDIVARELGLRYNRPSSEDAYEASSDETLRQADIAWSVWTAATDPSLYSADALADFRFADYGEVRREVVQYAVSLVGTPYVWAGEWPVATPDGYPYGAQLHGGFDCSGFIWYVLKRSSDTYQPDNRPYKGWSIDERSSADMAKATKERLGYKELLPGDVVFFAPNGKDSKASDVYHAGLYLGRGWMIHSSGSRAGISIGSIAPGSWWHDEILWGRRVITN